MAVLVGKQAPDFTATAVFGNNEIKYVRMVHAQDAHVRTPPGAPLLDRLRRRVEDLHERDRAAGHPCGALDGVVRWPQSREAEPRAASAVVGDEAVGEVRVNVRDGQVEDTSPTRR